MVRFGSDGALAMGIKCEVMVTVHTTERSPRCYYLCAVHELGWSDVECGSLAIEGDRGMRPVRSCVDWSLRHRCCLQFHDSKPEESKDSFSTDEGCRPVCKSY